MIYHRPSTRKFLYGDLIRFTSTGEYRAHEGHIGQISKTRIFKGPGTRHSLRYQIECSCGSTLQPIGPNLQLLDRPFEDPDVSRTAWEARARYLLNAVGVPENEQASLTSQIEDLTNQLSPREGEIVLTRHGLTDEGQLTLQELADRMGVTRTRTHQIAQRAMRKLRRRGTS